jgi:alkyl sulfatase BDS1-like metallo-beta-lactamase superfamily hydrolase
MRKPATSHTRAANTAVDFALDADDFARVDRGFIASIPGGRIDDPATGRMVWDISRYDFIADGTAAPDTVNPSLWRQAQLNRRHGLFEVAPKCWQVRGYDISNITFIEGSTGWIVIDPLTSGQSARASLALANQHLGERPVVAVIYTHSHADHFGGVLGVTTQADVDAGRCIVIAPEGFLHEAVSENIIAGPAMLRRSAYQFGPLLPPGADAHIDAGLGKGVPHDISGLVAPTHDITHTGQEMTVDGVRIVFQLTPETEAPAEMNFFFPDFGWLCTAENCTHTMHNLVPIRGAQVRNALAWSKYINESIELFGEKTDLMFASHHWPRWGREDVRGFLTLQRDLYKWMHDQTMRLANKGFVPTEIAAEIRLPDEFLAQGHTRGYYGDLVHNCKAVYQRYLSWYDGNPANLNKLAPSDAGARYVELAGGADALLAKARAWFDAGEYRWVAELLNHLVFADPGNTAARELQADTLEQLGYQAESSTFRNAYLQGAQELRNGPVKLGGANARGKGILGAMTVEQIFDTISVRLKSESVGGQSALVNWVFTDVDEKWVLGLSNRTLYAVPGRHDDHATVTVTTSRSEFIRVMLQETTFMDQIAAGNITLDGDPTALLTIFGNIDAFEPGFNVVEP